MSIRLLPFALLAASASAQPLTLERVETTPGLSPASVQAVLQKTLPTWTACGLRARPDSSDFDGRVTLSFRIGEAGRLVERRSHEGLVVVHGALMGACVASLVANAPFPRPQWGEPVDVEVVARLQLDKAAVDEQRRRFGAELDEWCVAYRQALKARPKADDASFTAADAASAALLQKYAPKASTPADIVASQLSLPGRALLIVAGSGADLERMQRLVEAFGVTPFCAQK